jgi:ABC-type branched-subunit amino acid transport system ATPase component
VRYADSPSNQVGLMVADLTVRFGGVTALDRLTLSVRSSEILGVIGPNGAGKTTLFNVITGVFRPAEGRVCLDGRDLSGLRQHQITTLGVARTFQNIRLFEDQTVLANVMLAADCRRRDGVISALMASRSNRKAERAAFAQAHNALAFVGLAGSRAELAGNLSYGGQRRLEIARALATNPRLVLLDEPAAGSNQIERQELAALIRRIRADGRGVLLIEHDMSMILELCDRVLVLEFGRRIAEGLPDAIRSDPNVVRAYLGDVNAA